MWLGAPRKQELRAFTSIHLLSDVLPPPLLETSALHKNREGEGRICEQRFLVPTGRTSPREALVRDSMDPTRRLLQLQGIRTLEGWVTIYKTSELRIKFLLSSTYQTLVSDAYLSRLQAPDETLLGHFSALHVLRLSLGFGVTDERDRVLGVFAMLFRQYDRSLNKVDKRNRPKFLADYRLSSSQIF